MPGSLLEAITTDLEVISRYVPARVDAFGTVLATFEGAHGGATLLVWAPRTLALEVLRKLPTAYRGRIVLGLDASGGDLLPFERALDASGAEAALLVREEPGIFHSGGGWKVVERGRRFVRAPLGDAAEPISELRTAPTGLRYRELRAYPAWSAPALNGSRPGSPAPQGHAAAARGLVVYAAGLLDLEEAWTPLLERLQALL